MMRRDSAFCSHDWQVLLQGRSVGPQRMSQEGQDLLLLCLFCGVWCGAGGSQRQASLFPVPFVCWGLPVAHGMAAEQMTLVSYQAAI